MSENSFIKDIFDKHNLVMMMMIDIISLQTHVPNDPIPDSALKEIYKTLRKKEIAKMAKGLTSLGYHLDEC